jgi:phosphoglycerate dehydrogenase-like enzyme
LPWLLLLREILALQRKFIDPSLRGTKTKACRSAQDDTCEVKASLFNVSVWFNQGACGTTQAMNVLIVVHHRFELWRGPRWFVERLRVEFPEVQFSMYDNYEDAARDLSQADIAVTWSLRPEQLARAPTLRWIHSPAAAVHQLMIPEIVNSEIVVTNASRVQGPVVAEHVIALVMAMAKLLPFAVRFQQRRQWAQTELWKMTPHPREVAGATMGLVGVGSIGGEVARRALALGMRVIAVREHPERGADFAAAGADVRVRGTAEFDEVLPECDYVVLAAPVTSGTKCLMDDARLRLMKETACLINVSRGVLVDEAALVCALREGRLGGAALDVFEKEPLPEDSPLWDEPKVLITPHSAALTEKLWERHYALFASNLRRWIKGEPLESVVDKKRGY